MFSKIVLALIVGFTALFPIGLVMTWFAPSALAAVGSIQDGLTAQEPPGGDEAAGERICESGR